MSSWAAHEGAIEATHPARSTRGQPRERLVALLPALHVATLLLAGAATSLVLYATPWGTGTGWDQVMYIGAARSLLAGRGLTIAWGAEAGQPLTHFPPLFPLILAGIGTLGIDPFDGARYLNAVLRGVNLLLLVALVHHLAPATPLAAVIAGLLFFTSVHVASLHGQAWSEPLFLPLCFSALLLMAGYLNRPGLARLMAGAALTGAAILTRYVGVSIVLTAAILILGARLTWTRRLRDTTLFIVVSLLPLLVWGLGNLLAGERPVGDRVLAWHPASLQHAGQVVYVALDWLIPNQAVTRIIGSDGVPTALGLALLPLLGLGVAVCVRRAIRDAAADLRTDAAGWFTSRVLPVFVPTYVVTVFAARSALDAAIQVDSRTLVPVYISLVILSSLWLGHRASWLHEQPNVRIAAAACALIVATMLTVRYVVTIQRAHEQGVSYSSTKWLTSPVMITIGALPEHSFILSNAPEAIYILKNRNAFWLPSPEHTDAAAALIDTQIRQHARPVFIAHFTDEDIAYRDLSPARLEPRFDLQPILHGDDGTLYQVLVSSAPS
jgi:hypothetical protein